MHHDAKYCHLGCLHDGFRAVFSGASRLRLLGGEHHAHLVRIAAVVLSHFIFCMDRRAAQCGERADLGAGRFGEPEEIAAAVGPDRILIALDSKNGKIVVKGWQEATDFTAEEIVNSLEPYCGGFLCTYVDKEGMMQGTDLDWFRRLRAATSLELTAAGGITTVEEIRELQRMNIHAALGMAVYTGRLDLADLARIFG